MNQAQPQSTNPTKPEQRMTTAFDHRRQEVQQIIKNASDQLNQEGVDARNYVEQIAWLFFLKAFDEAEARREDEAAFDGNGYTRRLAGDYAWSSWAKDTDHPDAMLDFVNGPLWTKLTSTEPGKGLGDDELAERFRRIFQNVRNYCRRGVTFARVVAQIDRLHFADDTDVHVLSEIYEDLLKKVAADSAGYAGEFYSQRHIVRAMVQVVRRASASASTTPASAPPASSARPPSTCAPPATSAARHIPAAPARDLLRRRAQAADLPARRHEHDPARHRGRQPGAGQHPGAAHRQRAGAQKYQVILANPPYGGKLAQQLQKGFRVRSSATECLFVQHIMANLAKGGRAGVIVPEGVLFRGGPDQKVRKALLEQFRVHTILSLPAGCFLPYTGVKTNVIFFDRPRRTAQRKPSGTTN
jgi:type I restriction enzyme M protein